MHGRSHIQWLTRRYQPKRIAFQFKLSLAAPDLKKKVWWNCVQKVFSQKFWLDDVYKLRKCYANIDSARSAWSNKSLMVLRYFYSISTVLTPTQQKWLVLVFILPLFLAMNLPEVISMSRNSFDTPVWHHQIWNGAIWLELHKFLQRQTFSTQFHQTLFEGRAPRDYFELAWLKMGPFLKAFIHWKLVKAWTRF